MLLDWDGAGGARLLSEVHGGRTRGKENKIEDRKIHLDIRNSVLTLRAVKHQCGAERLWVPCSWRYKTINQAQP